MVWRIEKRRSWRRPLATTSRRLSVAGANTGGGRTGRTAPFGGVSGCARGAGFASTTRILRSRWSPCAAGRRPGAGGSRHGAPWVVAAPEVHASVGTPQVEGAGNRLSGAGLVGRLRGRRPSYWHVGRRGTRGRLEGQEGPTGRCSGRDRVSR